MISASHLRSIMRYDPETGQFHWINHRRFGDGLVGNINKTDGYWQTNLGSLGLHRLHRLACLYMTGKWPSGEIDHINRNRSDNRWVNLREVSHSQNQVNRKVRNPSGHSGVYKKRGKFRVVLGRRHLGTFPTIEAAISARRSAENSYIASGV